MSDYAYVADRAKRANASIAALERALLSNPDNQAAKINLAAMRKLARQSEAELEDLASKNAVEICRYRLVPMHSDEYGLGPIAKSLFEYQQMFSQIYDSFNNGIKSNKGVGAESKQKSMLEFAYTFSGSLGVVLLARSERDFFAGNLDASIEMLYNIININNAESVREIASQRGTAVIKTVNDWCKANIEGGFSTDVKWKRSDGRYLGQMVNVSRFSDIAEIINSAADEQVEHVKVRGMMVAGNISSGSFQISVPGGETYSGSFHTELNRPSIISLGVLYDAVIEINDTYYYATDRHVRSNKLFWLSSPLGQDDI